MGTGRVSVESVELVGERKQCGNCEWTRNSFMVT